MILQGKQYRLSDGRVLGYAEYGDLSGWPEFYFPGFPGSRLEGRVMDTVARRLGVRIIAVDRPGVGISTPKPGRTLLDWPSDIAELADGLGLECFSLMGHSGGGPYAAACAVMIPQRLAAVGMVSSVGPVDEPETARGILRAARTAFLLRRRIPRLLNRPYELTARCIGRHPRRVLSLLDRTAPLPDRLLLAQPELKGMLWDSHCESVRVGHSGVEQDLRILTSPWGFRLQDIPMKVHLWHGALDRVVPPAVGRHLAGRMPYCEARFYADEGHVSVPINRMEDILGAMACERPNSK